MEQKLTYLDEKEILISKLNSIGCNLLRDDSDIDFGLLDKKRENEIYDFLINENFVCTGRDKSKMNFKKIIECKIIDIDIEMNTKYLKQYFYDIEIKESFEDEYFKNPDNNQIAMKTIRYLMLLRGRQEKYKKFIIDNKEIIIENNYFIDRLTKSPFKKNIQIEFDTFLKVLMAGKKALLENISFKYIMYFIWIKIKNRLFKTRGKIIAIHGVDGVGKSTVISVLARELNSPYLYMGERDFIFESFYKKKKFFFIKPLSLIGQYVEKVYRYIKAYNMSQRNTFIFCDRYHRYSRTATSNRFIDNLNKIFFFFYPKADIDIVLWNESDEILKRKQEVTKEYIDTFNEEKEKYFKGAFFIKNDDLDVTLNKILKIIYA